MFSAFAIGAPFRHVVSTYGSLSFDILCDRSTAAHAMYKVCVTEDLPEFPPDLSADAVDFLEKLLQRDPLTRPAVGC